MRILFLSISYNFINKSLYNDLVDCLIEKGHTVTVITSNATDDYSTNNLNVIGFKEKMTGNSNLLRKGMSTILIGHRFINSLKRIKNKEFDLLIYATPPITFNKVIKYCKKKYHCKTYLMLKDIFPQNAVDLDMFHKCNPIYWYFRHQEKQLYLISDRIGCMSQGNINYIINHNTFLDPKKIEVFYNSIAIRDKTHIQEGKKETTFIFGGNIGKPQNIDFVLDVIYKLRKYKYANFIIIGKGSDDYKVKNFVATKKLNNLKYYDYLPSDKYEKILENADVGLISLDPRFTIPNIPSKLPTYMNYMKPVLAITDNSTDLKDIIFDANCGWWSNVESGEVINKIKYICSNKDEQIRKGNYGFHYLKENFDVNKNVEQLEKFMED